MWRYLPPAVLMVCSALVLIAGATGDLQSWSQSIDELPSLRTVMDSWPPATRMWASGAALFQRDSHAPSPASLVVPAGVTGTSPSSPLAPAKASPTHQAVITQPAAAPMPAASTPVAPVEPAATPVQRRLIDARHALTAGRADEARRMLETARAEMAFQPTREGGSVQADMPATWVGQALLSLKSGDSTGALHDLDLAIASS